ncbi:hypothetical protein D3C76_1028310 [compost metagenome]
MAAQQRGLFLQGFQGELGVKQLALTGDVHAAEIREGILYLFDGQQPYPVVQIAGDVANGRRQRRHRLGAEILAQAA